MGCANCAVGKDGKPAGCQSNGDCLTGGCNRLNTFDWLSKLDLAEPEAFEFLEVSFKNGARKSFYKHHDSFRVDTGELVVVEAQNGYDIGTVSLNGELVRLQMKKKRTPTHKVHQGVIRRASERDLMRLNEVRSLEMQSLVLPCWTFSPT